MSSHFKSAANDAAREAAEATIGPDGETVKPTFAKRFVAWGRRVFFFRPTDMKNPDHKKLMRQAQVRLGIVMCFMTYYGYQHPEYSIVSAWWHGSDKPLAEQQYLKMSGGESPGTERDQRTVMTVMQGSNTASLPEPKGPFR